MSVKRTRERERQKKRKRETGLESKKLVRDKGERWGWG